METCRNILIQQFTLNKEYSYIKNKKGENKMYGTLSKHNTLYPKYNS